MSQATTHESHSRAVVNQLDDLIRLLERPTSESEDLLLEHIHSARTYWLGAMPREFTIALEDARCAAGQLQDADHRHTLDKALDHLQAEVEHVYPRSTRSAP
jgi:hypothetical protein